jgi:hypothetical protein
VALAGYAVLLGRNLLGARGMPGVVAHVWTAFASLLVLILTAFALAFAYVGLPLVERSTALALHVAFAAYGFMGMLSLGLSYILVPMFALAKAPDERLALVSCALGAIALALAGVAAFGIGTRELRIVAIAVALAAVGIHLGLMRQALRSGLRRELGTSFRLVRTAWGLLVASLVAALLWELDAPVPGMATLFGIGLVAGWLLTFLLGVLQRIVPFLASMHAIPGGGRPPTPSTLTDDRALAVHGWCHGAALALLAFAVLFDSSTMAAVAAVIGALGGVAYGIFFAGVGRGMQGHLPGAAPPAA